MTRQRTRGFFSGEYQEDRGKPEEINAPVDVEVDPDAGIVRTRVREQRSEIRNKRYARTVGHFQQQLRDATRRDAYANRTITPIPKPGKSADSTTIEAASGFRPCPDCDNGAMTYDMWECPTCEGAGMVPADADD